MKPCSSSGPTTTRCAACQMLRRRCREECTFAPYFPSTDPQRFACVHRVFGASNVSKMLQQLPVQLRAKAANCMFFEAHERIQDPVYGCVRIISVLQHQLSITQQQIAITRAQLAWFQAQSAQLHHQQLQQQQQQIYPGEPFYYDTPDIIPVTSFL